MVETYTDVTVTDDCFIEATDPTYNYGVSTNLDVAKNWPSTYDARALVKIVAPSKPIGATGNPRPRIRIYCSTAPAAGLLIQVFKISRTATEVLEGSGNGSATGDGATWNTYNGVNNWTIAGGDYNEFLGQGIVTTTGWNEFSLGQIGLDWGQSAWVILRCADETSGSDGATFNSAENGSNKPVIRWYYDDDVPKKIVDLKAVPYQTDPRKVKLTWSSNDDVDFASYKIRRSTSSPVLYSDTLVETITGQSTSEYIDSTDYTGNIVYFFAIFIEDGVNTGINGSKSNETWMIRPKIFTHTWDASGPVFSEAEVWITPDTYVSTPTPVTDTHGYVEWGSGSDPDVSSAWVPIDEIAPGNHRVHRYPYVGSHSGRVAMRNSLGFETNKSSPATITVTSINPVAKIRASPRLIGLNTDVNFYGDESYASAGNRSLAASNAYEWDKDYSGAFSADYTTTLPYQAMQWTGAGTKTVALRVKDEDGLYSSVVTMTVIVVAEVTTALDNLVDGFEVLDLSEGRHGAILDGMESYEITAGSEKPKQVSIEGFAYTDTDVDGVPDDIETLRDVVTNNKKVSLTVDGTSRTGRIMGDLETHNEGGWGNKRSWRCAITLE